MILHHLFKAKPGKAGAVYAVIVAASRQRHFYADWGVADTVDGRFDLLVLHLALVVSRLKGEHDLLRQQLIDHFCIDMDDNLRELGAGDLSVSKKVRRMAEAFQGRYSAYDAAQDHAKMAATLERNVYAGKSHSGCEQLAEYVMNARVLLQQKSKDEIAEGKYQFS